MIKGPILYVLVVLSAFLLAACSQGAAEVVQEPPAQAGQPDVQSEEATDEPTPAPTISDQSEQPTVETTTDDSEPVVEEASFAPRPHRSAPADPEVIIEDSAEFFAATGSPQLVEIFTYWCTVCARIRPTVHALEADYWGQIDFLYIDRENPANTELNQLLGVRYQPEFYLVSPDGAVVESWFGARSEEDMRTILDGYLQSGG